MDRILTEVPKSLGALYQQSRVALQHLLHTEARLLCSPVLSGAPAAAECGGPRVVGGPNAGSSHDASNGDGEDRAAWGPPDVHDLTAQQLYNDRHDERSGDAQEVAGSRAGAAACACGRPLLLGTAGGWLRVPVASHSRARRTVSGKKRCGFAQWGHRLGWVHMAGFGDPAAAVLPPRRLQHTACVPRGTARCGMS